MNFRGWIESDIRVTDRWPLNKATYDMDTPKGRMQYEIDLEELLDRVKKPSKMVVSERLVREPHTITCWRGFDMKSFKRDIVEENGSIFIKGDRAMEGMLWFTHSLQPLHDFDPREFAVGHARGDGYLLTYPLRCERRYKQIKYDDGSSATEAPDERVNQTELSEKGLFWGELYALPRGWYFTWQVQKHIGFKGRLEIKQSMLERVTT